MLFKLVTITRPKFYMNYFLMLIILGLCGGGYYGYTQLQQKGIADQQHISDQSAKLDSLQAENKKLADEETQLKKNADDAAAEVSDLTTQVQEAQSALTAAKSCPALYETCQAAFAKQCDRPLAPTG